MTEDGQRTVDAGQCGRPGQQFCAEPPGMTCVNTDTLLPRVSVWFGEHFHESFVYSLLVLSVCLFSRGLGQSLPMYVCIRLLSSLILPIHREHSSEPSHCTMSAAEFIQGAN